MLDSLPSYFFSLYKAPVSVLNKLESVRCSCFWGGSSTSKKIPWVSWDRVIAPLDSGALGLGCLHTKNLSLISKWWWRFRTEPHSLWCRTITSIHFSQRQCHPVPFKAGLVGAWLTIAKLSSHFESFDLVLHHMFTGTIGNGSSIRFWIDPWFNNKPLSITFPDLYKLEKFKGCSIKDLCTRKGAFLQWKWNWKKPPSTPIELHQLQELLASVYNINLSDSPEKMVLGA